MLEGELSMHFIVGVEAILALQRGDSSEIKADCRVRLIFLSFTGIEGHINFLSTRICRLHFDL